MQMTVTILYLGNQTWQSDHLFFGSLAVQVMAKDLVILSPTGMQLPQQNITASDLLLSTLRKTLAPTFFIPSDDLKK